MKTATEYRTMAEECFRWAREAKAKEVRVSLVQLAQVWLDAASKLDGLPATRTRFCPRSADVMPITKIHFLEKAREGLWITAKNNPRFLVRDHNGQTLAYIYFEDEPGRRSAAKLLERHEARRIAVNIAKLPEPRAAGGGGRALTQIPGRVLGRAA